MNSEKMPLLSACVITYNQDKYIEKCLEGCLKQKVDFDYEIVIGDDNSTDKTSRICKRVEEEYPTLVSYERNTTNLGMIKNWIKTINRCRGKYIAICEGDDYWTDPLKLQKQVDFLEANPDFAITFHRVEIVNENGIHKFFSNYNQKEIMTFEDLAVANRIYTPSCIFRNRLFEDFPDWFIDCPVGDYPIHLLNAVHGKIKFFEDVMCAYRLNANSTWGLKPINDKAQKWYYTVNILRNHFYPRADIQFKVNLSSALVTLCFALFNIEDFEQFRDKYKFFFKENLPLSKRTELALKLRYYLSFLPSFAKAFNKITNRRYLDQTKIEV